MVNLTRIYTKTGDDGTTSLGDMSRTSKNDPRLEAYATVDEANSTIGVVLSTDELTEEVRALLVRIQNDLFDVGADLCTPVVDSPAFEPLRVLESQITYLEEQIDKYNAHLRISSLICFAIRYTSSSSPSCGSHSCSSRRALHLGSYSCFWWRSKSTNREVPQPLF